MTFFLSFSLTHVVSCIHVSIWTAISLGPWMSPWMSMAVWALSTTLPMSWHWTLPSRCWTSMSVLSVGCLWSLRGRQESGRQHWWRCSPSCGTTPCSRTGTCTGLASWSTSQGSLEVCVHFSFRSLPQILATTVSTECTKRHPQIVAMASVQGPRTLLCWWQSLIGTRAVHALSGWEQVAVYTIANLYQLQVTVK